MLRIAMLALPSVATDDLISPIRANKMPSPKLSPEAWKQVQIASEAGCTDEELTRVYGITRNAIKQRRWREKWNTPAVLAREAEMKRNASKLSHITAASVTSVTEGAKTAQMILSERGEHGSLLASQLLLSLLERAAKAPDRVRPLTSVGDVSVALNGIRKAAGMDKQEQQSVSVSLALFASGGEKPWRDVSPEGTTQAQE